MKFFNTAFKKEHINKDIAAGVVLVTMCGMIHINYLLELSKTIYFSNLELCSLPLVYNFLSFLLPQLAQTHLFFTLMFIHYLFQISLKAGICCETTAQCFSRTDVLHLQQLLFQNNAFCRIFIASLREKCFYLECFWLVYSRIRILFTQRFLQTKVMIF